MLLNSTNHIILLIQIILIEVLINCTNKCDVQSIELTVCLNKSYFNLNFCDFPLIK